jgi:hypothetical protein
MRQIKRHLGVFLAVTWTLCPLGAGAQDAVARREDPVRIQVNINLFFPGPTGESDEAVKLRERVRRTVYEMAASECVLVEQALAKTCRLESINVNLNRQAGSGQGEGYLAVGNFAMRATVK